MLCHECGRYLQFVRSREIVYADAADGKPAIKHRVCLPCLRVYEWD